MRIIGISIAAVLGWTQPARAEFTPEQLSFFESKIRPVLVDSCYECHSAESGKSKGGLVVDTKLGLRRGGNSGEAVVPHDLDGSLLWTAINWSDPDSEMPPKTPLPRDVIEDFRTWIEMGAPDPREADYVVQSDVDLEEGRTDWAFQEPEKPSPPAVRNASWPRSEIDRFLLARLEAEGLEPVRDAKPLALLRRLHFDLVGLPPAPEELRPFLRAWEADPERAVGAVVDRLLESERFGERWGRHWLDVARYAESSGKEVNVTFPHAWRYRDYVIDSFNADKPYDEFLLEQLAGDLLPIRDDGDWQENLIATSFLALGTKGLNEQNARQFAFDQTDEQIDTTTQAFLGLTVACARCHDHKFDPIPTTDYYAMAGIFLSTETYFGTVRALQNRNATDLLLLPVADASPDRLPSRQRAFMEQRLARAEEQIVEARRQLRQERMSRSMSDSDGNGANPIRQVLRLSNTISQLRARLNAYDEEGRAKTFAMGVQDREKPIDAQVLLRGEWDKPAQEVPRGFLQVLQEPGHSASLPDDASGRLELARWMASEDNPLTARVMVNRIWHHLFGRGIVASLNNFGAMGKAPTHPELLDFLAVRFMEEDWSVKALIREIVLTRAYQLSSDFQSANYSQDPDNELLWRSSPRRLDAESIRDAMLVASGELVLDRPEGSMVADIGDGAVGRRLGPDAVNRTVPHRSVYLPIVRDLMPESLALFDGADPSIVTAEREVTNVPSQSLYLMNSPFVLRQSESMGRLLAKRFDTPREQVAHAFLRTYGRLATPEEIESCIAFFRAFRPAAQRSLGGETVDQLALTSFCQALLCSAEFRFLN